MAFGPIVYPSYAKINLFLHIINKRCDGFHNLQTWFQFIDLKDFLKFSSRKEDDKIKLNSSVTVTECIEDNLIYKAALALKPFAKVLCGVNITITKNIPFGAGLGGGSSNAATTLIALNLLWQCNLSKRKLQKIGQKLGADVPIFLLQKAALAEGTGDILIPKLYKEQYALIIKSRPSINTSTFFKDPQLKRQKKLLKSDIKNPLLYRNVFLDIFTKLYPKTYNTLKQLPYAKLLRLTGTGSCFYLLNEDYQQLLINQKKLKKDIDSWIVKTLNYAPIEPVE